MFSTLHYFVINYFVINYFVITALLCSVVSSGSVDNDWVSAKFPLFNDNPGKVFAYSAKIHSIDFSSGFEKEYGISTE